jgi:hypothetical protein
MTSIVFKPVSCIRDRLPTVRMFIGAAWHHIMGHAVILTFDQTRTSKISVKKVILPLDNPDALG